MANLRVLIQCSEHIHMLRNYDMTIISVVGECLASC